MCYTTLIIKHIIKEYTKYITQRINLNMPHDMSEVLRENRTTTIMKFLIETKIINVLYNFFCNTWPLNCFIIKCIKLYSEKKNVNICGN